MKAVLYTQYGSPTAVLRLAEMPQPTPQPDEVLIRVKAAGINAAEKHLINGQPFLVRLMVGLNKPKDPRTGADVAGEVIAIGATVQNLKVGDAVFGQTKGAYAEYTCAKEQNVVRKPAALTFEQAAAVPMAALTALQGLRDHGQLQTGQRVLVNGAGGGVGTFAVQIAKALGAHVTATSSPRKLALVSQLGADVVVDYQQTDVTRSGQQYDLVLDCGLYRSVRDYAPILKPHGRYVLIGGSMDSFFANMFQGMLLSAFGSRKYVNFVASTKQADLQTLSAMLEQGQIKPIIDRTYPLTEVVEAFRHFISGQVGGKIVLTVS